jgi:hypothetical protein
MNCKYDKILSIGHRCTSQIVINNIKNDFNNDYGETTPFSWVNFFNVKNVLFQIKNNFKNFFDHEHIGENYHL